MKTGYRPWLDLEDAAGTPWIFNPQYLTVHGWKSVPLLEAPFEWQAQFENWYGMTFQSAFDIRDGMNNNVLGVTTNCRISFNQMKERLNGFFEEIPYGIWCYLRDNNYQFLHNFMDVNNRMQYGILYGPISLCNKLDDDNIATELSYSNRNGTAILWRFTYIWGYNDVGGGVIDLSYDDADVDVGNTYHLLNVEHAEEDDEGIYSPFVCSDILHPETVEILPFKKTSYAVRVRLSLMDRFHEELSFFDAQEAVHVYFPLNVEN
jgi:hypothetical protein